jgi:hypothetical protein
MMLMPLLPKVGKNASIAAAGLAPMPVASAKAESLASRLMRPSADQERLSLLGRRSIGNADFTLPPRLRDSLPCPGRAAMKPRNCAVFGRRRLALRRLEIPL